MSCLFLICMLSLLVGEGVLTINNTDYSIQNFYNFYPKKRWAIVDSTQKSVIFDDFIKRRLCVLEATAIGLDKDPYIAVKIKNITNQILVNESYEQLVAWPLIDPAQIVDAKKFALNEISLSHILIGHSDSYLAVPPNRTLDESFLLSQNIKKSFLDGDSFESLAKQYSDDPSVKNNLGSLGWVAWGATVPAFQSVAFVQRVGALSDPVLTSFGYHLILVKDSRPSDFQYMSEEEYESTIINISKGSIRGLLRGAAMVYDSIKIKEYGVYFNESEVFKIVQAYNQKKTDGISVQSININVSDLLSSLTPGVVCVYGGHGYGALWFSNKIKSIPVGRHPSLNSIDGAITVFKTIILQDIALKRAVDLKIDLSFPFLERRNFAISDLLYDTYLKYLINDITVPDSSEVLNYYNNNKSNKYLGGETVSFREIRVQSRNLADSLLSLISAGMDFVSLAHKYSIINSASGGLIGPVGRDMNRSFFDATTQIDIGAVTPVLSSPGNNFSILFLVERGFESTVSFNSVFSSIEALLIKERHTLAKRVGIDGLKNKYNIKKHENLLSW